MSIIQGGGNALPLKGVSITNPLLLSPRSKAVQKLSKQQHAEPVKCISGSSFGVDLGTLPGSMG